MLPGENLFKADPVFNFGFSSRTKLAQSISNASTAAVKGVKSKHLPLYHWTKMLVDRLYWGFNQLLFSHALAKACEMHVRDENTLKRKFASTPSQTHNHRVMSLSCSPLGHPGGAWQKWKFAGDMWFKWWNLSIYGHYLQLDGTLQICIYLAWACWVQNWTTFLHNNRYFEIH